MNNKLKTLYVVDTNVALVANMATNTQKSEISLMDILNRNNSMYTLYSRLASLASEAFLG